MLDLYIMVPPGLSRPQPWHIRKVHTSLPPLQVALLKSSRASLTCFICCIVSPPHPETIIAPRMRSINVIHFLPMIIIHPLSFRSTIFSFSPRRVRLLQPILNELQIPSTLSSCFPLIQIWRPLKNFRHCSTRKEPVLLLPLPSIQQWLSLLL